MVKFTAKLLLSRSLNNNDTYHIAKSYRLFGLYYENSSLNDSAFYYYTKAGKLFLRLNKTSDICDNYIDKASIQYYTNDYLASDQSLINALEYAKKGNKRFAEYLIYQSLGINSSEMNDYNNSLKYFDKAIGFFEDSKLSDDGYSPACAIFDKAKDYYNLKNYDKSLIYLNTAFKVSKKKDVINLCSVLDYIARIKIKKRDFKTAKLYLLKSSNIRDSLNIDSQRNFNKLYFSEYFQATNDSLNSQQFARDALNLSKNFHAPKDMLICLQQLSKVDTKNALKYSQEYIRISDSMQLLERQNRNKFAKIAYETEELTNEKDQAIQQKWIFLGVAIAVFIIVALLLTVMYLRGKRKELKFLQKQQEKDIEIFQLIQKQQHKINEGRKLEKTRIAKDLHDGIMNDLASTRINLHMLNENSNKQTIRKCIQLINGIEDIEKEIQNISQDINGEKFLSVDNFAGVVQDLLNDQKDSFGIALSHTIDTNICWENISNAIKINLYRILQESLQNINKYAKAKNITVELIRVNDSIMLRISDDGLGFKVSKARTGIGIQNMQSRTLECMGNFELKSKKGKGTVITITIPIMYQTNNLSYANQS